MSTNSFYNDLVPLNSFEDVVNNKNHTNLPEDWWIIISDVMGSTNAIEAGKYREVNSIGASTIITILNVNRDIQVPYIFGGDGATLAVPPEMVHGAKEALLGAQKLSREGFSLDLRIGMIPVSELTTMDAWCKISKWQMSKDIVQAAISGRGWELAEQLIKDPDTRDKYEVVETESIKPNADFTGFECRWNPVESRKDHKLCLLVQASSSEQMEFYNRFFLMKKKIYGSTSDHHPLSLDLMSFPLHPSGLSPELTIRNSSLISRFFYRLNMLIENLIGTLVFSTGINLSFFNGTTYLEEFLHNTDYQKFEGMLKLVVDGSDEQSKQMEEFLEEEFQKENCIYGIFRAPQAIITCLIRSYQGDHTHLVDGSNGGYAMAAKNFKMRLKESKSRDSP
jgi:hypothetical protein